MTTPYRKAAEVNEPRVRYGWRLTEFGLRVIRGSFLALLSGGLPFGLAFALGGPKEVGLVAAIVGFLGFMALATLTCQVMFGEYDGKRFFERYEKP